jgi:hypothetical protein
VLHDPFQRSRLPGDFSRAGRVLLLAEVFQALLAGRTPDRAAALFVAGAGMAWLEEGGATGSLERDFLRISPPHRSTLTPTRIWARSTARATSASEVETIPAMETNEPGAPSPLTEERIREIARQEIERQLGAVVSELARQLAVDGPLNLLTKG